MNKRRKSIEQLRAELETLRRQHNAEMDKLRDRLRKIEGELLELTTVEISPKRAETNRN